MKRFLTLLLLCLLSLLGCDGGAGTAVSPTAPLPTLPPIASVPATATHTALPIVLPTATPRPTQPPRPTATYSPDLVEWTVLVYMDADNNLELAGLLDMNEMESAGQSADVNVVVQIDRAFGEAVSEEDWTETRRYLIQADSDPERINSPLIATLGEQNMGSAQTFADFISWGIQTYPANRYALVVWDHGAGWNGIAFDEFVPDSDATDRLDMHDLATGLDLALTETALDKLDIVAFDACLMGQLEVFQTLQPFADYAVGSQELTPGRGWNYQTLLAQLHATSATTADSFARHMVTDFAQTYNTDDFVTMTAVSLADLPALTYATELLANALGQQPQLTGAATLSARSGTQTFARAYADEAEQYAAIDLYHFAQLLTQFSPDQTIINRAEQVMAKVETAVLAHNTGAGLRNAHGIALYFPRYGELYDPAYGEMTRMPAWDTFLQQYHSTALANLTPPNIEIVNSLREVIGVQTPAFLEFELAGQEIEQVVLLAGQREADGRLRLLEYDPLIPEPTYLPNGERLYQWQDGIHEDFYRWQTEVTYLFDVEENGAFVVMLPVSDGDSLFAVSGQYRRLGSEEPQLARLVFDHRLGQLVRVWGEENGGLSEILPQAGDTFQLDTLFLLEDGSIGREPSEVLTFSAERKLYYDWRPLPDGAYTLGFRAENAIGQTDTTFIDLIVQNETPLVGYRAYLDPYLGFEFLYPDDWFSPIYTDTLLYAPSQTDVTQMQLKLYPDLEQGIGAVELKEQTLAIFGEVDILNESHIVIANRRGLQTAYGYTRLLPDGTEEPHTGIFFTFVYAGVGFVVDVDGRQVDEPATLQAVQMMVESWQFQEVGYGLQPGNWNTITLDDFVVAQPNEFTYRDLNGWQRFEADVDTFVAIRLQESGTDLSALLTSLVTDAGTGVDGFVAQEAILFPLGGHIWQRVAFDYLSSRSTPIRGFIMVTQIGETAVIAWAEAPATVYEELEKQIFLVMVADVSLK